MFKTDSFLGNKKFSLNQNVFCDHATITVQDGQKITQNDLGEHKVITTEQ